MIIGGRKACGKTTELIKKAAEEDLYIVCTNPRRATHIAEMARRMGLNIRFPITVMELPIKSPFIEKVLIDDIEDVLREVIGKPIAMMSTSMEMKNL